IEFKDNNFRYQEVDRESSISQKIALLTDLIANDMAEEVLKISEIKKLYVVLYDSSASNKYLGHVIYNREQLLPLVEEKKLQKDLLFYWRSGLPIRGNELDGFKGIELKSL
ncbi:MAG: hypothetical protein KC478_13920, partial [Bacteriovoracaceae bacterium]|nr:hypothetical protein [Bacteriovoracaceae bacterium]